MKSLIIIGARGFGREVFNLALDSVGYETEFTVKGFLDDNSNALDGYENYPPIISSCEDYCVEIDDVFTCALGNVKYKKQYASIIMNKGGQFVNLIHKDAFVSRNTVLGKGCLICSHTQISCDVKIGSFVSIQPFCAIGHDSVIGDWCHLNTYSFMGGFAQMGNGSTMHTGSILLPHKTIGENSILGAGSVAIRNIKNNQTSFGIPATSIL